MQSLCDRWEFVSDWYDGFAVGEGEGERVRLPHTVKEIPQHYADSQYYQHTSNGMPPPASPIRWSAAIGKS